MTERSVWQLRCQLGLSRADFARLMAVSWDQVSQWEAGVSAPTSDQRALLTRLGQQSDSYSEKTALRPILEVALKERGLDQIHSSEITLSGKTQLDN